MHVLLPRSSSTGNLLKVRRYLGTCQLHNSSNMVLVAFWWEKMFQHLVLARHSPHLLEHHPSRENASSIVACSPLIGAINDEYRGTTVSAYKMIDVQGYALHIFCNSKLLAITHFQGLCLSVIHHVTFALKNTMWLLQGVPYVLKNITNQLSIVN